MKCKSQGLSQGGRDSTGYFAPTCTCMLASWHDHERPSLASGAPTLVVCWFHTSHSATKLCNISDVWQLAGILDTCRLQASLQPCGSYVQVPSLHRNTRTTWPLFKSSRQVSTKAGLRFALHILSICVDGGWLLHFIQQGSHVSRLSALPRMALHHGP